MSATPLPAVGIVVDRRARPPWADRRDNPSAIPSGGLRGGQVARARQGRRATDDVPPAVAYDGGSAAMGSRRLGRFAHFAA